MRWALVLAIACVAACSQQKSAESEFVRASDEARVELSLFKASWSPRAPIENPEQIRGELLPELDRILTSLTRLDATAKAFRDASPGDHASFDRLTSALDGIARVTDGVRQARTAYAALADHPTPETRTAAADALTLVMSFSK